MGGAHFYWEVTLVEGQGLEGVYQLAEYITNLGEKRPSHELFKIVGDRLIQSELVGAIPYIGDDIDQQVLNLTSEKQKAVF